MDEKRLDEITEGLNHFDNGVTRLMRKYEWYELIRLARLGLQTQLLTEMYGKPESHRLIELGEWAEKHERYFKDNLDGICDFLDLTRPREDG